MSLETIFFHGLDLLVQLHFLPLLTYYLVLQALRLLLGGFKQSIEHPPLVGEQTQMGQGGGLGQLGLSTLTAAALFCPLPPFDLFPQSCDHSLQECYFDLIVEW